jgi:membrane protein implicated in regulation of membrane protease activity
MSRKTLLTIAASAELFLGAYFVLAFVAWVARVFVFNAGKTEFSPMLIVWASLAAASLWLYSKTMERIRDLEAAEAKLIEIAKPLEPKLESTEPAQDEAESHTLKS